MSKVAFLFPGQGAQSVGMGQLLHQQHAEVRQLFAEASELLGYDLAEICFSGPAERINATQYSQPALFVCSLAALEVMRKTTPEVVEQCEAAAGLSLGEYTAMVFAGAVPMRDCLRVVQVRGQAMQRAADENPSGMVSILGLSTDVVDRLCEQARQPGEVLQIANYLCPGNLVISGHRSACERASEIALTEGASKVIPLAVAGAFHTPLMQTAVEELRAALENVEIKPPKIPVISNVDAKAHSDPTAIREILVRQVCSAVQWEQSMRSLVDQQFTRFYEVGPGRVLRGLLKRISRTVTCEGVEGA